MENSVFLDATIDAKAFPITAKIKSFLEQGLCLPDLLAGVAFVKRCDQSEPEGIDSFLLTEVRGLADAELFDVSHILAYEAAQVTTAGSRLVLLISAAYPLAKSDRKPAARELFLESIELIDSDEMAYAKDEDWLRSCVYFAANWLAWIAYLDGRYEDGIPWSERALANCKNDWNTHAVHGSLLYALGKNKEAFKFLRAALKNGADPKPTDALRADPKFEALCVKYPTVVGEK